MTTFYIDVQPGKPETDKRMSLLTALEENFGIVCRDVVSVETDNPALTPLLEAIAEHIHHISRPTAILQTLEEIGAVTKSALEKPDEVLDAWLATKAPATDTPPEMVEGTARPLIELAAKYADELAEAEDEGEQGEALPIETVEQIAGQPCKVCGTPTTKPSGLCSQACYRKDYYNRNDGANRNHRKNGNGHEQQEPAPTKQFGPGVQVITGDDLPADVVRHISQGGAIRGKKL